MGLFDDYLLQIHGIIKIRDEDNEPYARDYDAIRDHVTNGLCSRSTVFKTLFGGTELFGSTSNNVRIYKPDERDVIVKLVPPFFESIYAESSDNCSGFVKLDFEELLGELDDSNYYEVYEALYDMVDDDEYLVRGRLRGWLTRLMKKFIKKNSLVQGYSGKWKLYYRPGGLAITIKAELVGGNKEISIDFVPGIMFKTPEWMRRMGNYSWYACPKASSNPNKLDRRLEFQIVNPQAEKRMLLNKYNLKVVYRLIKAYRNTHDLRKIKSVFFTTIFLWKVNKERRSYWQQPVSEIFLDILLDLILAFNEGYLAYFWASDHNLLSYFSDTELEEYASFLRGSYNTLTSYQHQPNLTLRRCCTHFLNDKRMATYFNSN